jgi:hypothetical protein
MQVIGGHPERLADPRAGVVEEEKQRMVALTRGTPPVGLLKENAHVFRLQVIDGADRGTLRAHSEDASILLGARDIVAKEVLYEPAHRGETAIACGRPIAAGDLDVVEECEHLIDGNVVEPEATDRATHTSCQEEEEEAERMPVRANRVWAGATNSAQVIIEVRLDE